MRFTRRCSQILAGLTAIGIVVAGCGGSDSATDSDAPAEADAPISTATTAPIEAATPTLADAEDVRAGALAGEPVPMGSEATDGHVIAVVSNPQTDGDDLGPWLEVDVRIENPTDEDVQYFNAGIICAGNDEMGGTVQGGTIDSSAGIPAGTFEEGTLLVLLPGDGRYGEATPLCETPAAVRIEVIGDDGMTPEQAVSWTIPEDLIATLNTGRTT